MSDYPEFTPTTEQVRSAYAHDPEAEYRDPVGFPAMQRENLRAFDRWLAAHDAQKRAEWEAEQRGRREFTAAYTTQSGVVCPFGYPTVVQADAQAVADEFSREDPDGPNYFVATRILPPWLPVTNTESEDK